MANKIVQLVDKNSNNLYPVAGAVITDAVSTGAISSQAVTNAKIENGAVNGVANDATAIGTAKLALDTVGTPNLRDESVTSDKIDWTTYKYVQIENTATYGTGGVNIPIAITSEVDNDFCTVASNVITFTKTGLYMLNLTAGRSLGPGANSTINIGVAPQGTNANRIIFVAAAMLANTAGQRMTSSMAVITAGNKYECKTLETTGGMAHLGNCDLFRLRITKIL